MDYRCFYCILSCNLPLTQPGPRCLLVYSWVVRLLRLALSKVPNREFTLYLRTETDPVSETLCSLEYRTMGEVEKPSNSQRILVLK
jgi:hypothetical protein